MIFNISDIPAHFQTLSFMNLQYQPEDYRRYGEFQPRAETYIYTRSSPSINNNLSLPTESPQPKLLLTFDPDRDAGTFSSFGFPNFPYDPSHSTPPGGYLTFFPYRATKFVLFNTELLYGFGRVHYLRALIVHIGFQFAFFAVYYLERLMFRRNYVIWIGSYEWKY